jgi:hypothetical protein
MEQKVYTFGVFPFGLGNFGIGPIIEEEEMNTLVKYASAGVLYTSLTKYGDVVLKDTPTVVAGDVQISRDGAAFVDMINLPAIMSTQVRITFDPSETVCSQAVVRFRDQTSPPEWNDKIVEVQTYGNTSAYIVDPFNGVTSASNFAPTDISSLATSAVQQEIKAGVDGLLIDVIFDPDHSLSALDTKIMAIPTNNNGIVVSASNLSEIDLTPVTSGVAQILAELANPVYGLSALRAKEDVLASEVLGSNIDGLTMEDALMRILSWATGRIEYNNNVFTYYKQDNATTVFALSADDASRTRA